MSVSTALQINLTSRVPVEGKSSVFLICTKYRIIILIIIIISLGQILLSYIENTSHHARTHARMHTHRRAFQVSAVRWVSGTQPWRPVPLATMGVAGSFK